MTYISGAKCLADIIEEIANDMIALADWSDGDTTWTTTDKTADNARRCLKYTGDANDIWIALEALNTSHLVYQKPGFSEYYYAKGLRVTVSASWDSVGHTYPADNQQTFISFELRYNGDASADLATLLLTYFAWYDNARGFVITAKPDPDSTDDYQNSFFLAVERVTTKEYTDGYTNFYVAAAMNYKGFYDNSYDTYQFRSYLRPFNFEYSPADHTALSYFYNHGVNHPEYLRAIKSNGNGKAYFARPIYQNEDGVRSPITESALWFGYSPAYGLVDGDIIAIDGSTAKYLLKALDSPDSANMLPFAIRYVE